MQESQSFISLSFTQGFILGQLSVCILLFLFIKFFIFGEAPTSNRYTQRPRSYSSPYAYNPVALSTSFSRPTSSSASNDPRNPQNKKHYSVLRPNLPLTIPTILAKTYYNVGNHQPESLDWFNVLIAQTIAQFRIDACHDDAIVSTLTAAINGPSKPDFLDDIKVTELSLGDEFPIFSNCRVIPVPATESSKNTNDGTKGGEEHGDRNNTRLQARMDVDLSDALTIGIETKLMLNYPRPRTAIMPVALAVSVVRFSGTLSVSFVPSPPTSTYPNPSSSPTSPPSAYATQSPPTTSKSRVPPNNTTKPQQQQQQPHPTTPPTLLTFSFSPTYRLELSTHSLLGSRSRLQDVPKIAQLVEARLHAWFDERCVSPRVQQVVLPSLWPRARNTRGGGHARGRSSEDSGGPGGGGEEEAVVGDLDVDVDTGREDRMVGVEAGEQLPLPRWRRQGGKKSAHADGVAGPHDPDSFGGMSPQQGRSTSSGYYRMPGSMPDM